MSDIDQTLDVKTADAARLVHGLVDAYERQDEDGIDRHLLPALLLTTQCALGWAYRLAEALEAFLKVPDIRSQRVLGQAAMNMKPPIVDMVMAANISFVTTGQERGPDFPRPDAAVELAEAELKVRGPEVLVAHHVQSLMHNNRLLWHSIDPVLGAFREYAHDPSGEAAFRMREALRVLVRHSTPLIVEFELSGVLLVRLCYEL